MNKTSKIITLSFLFISNVYLWAKEKPFSFSNFKSMIENHQYRTDDIKCTLTVNCGDLAEKKNRKILHCDYHFSRFVIEFENQFGGYPSCGQVIQGGTCFTLCSPYGLHFGKMNINEEKK